jgi:hypothetical protein
MKEMDSNLAYCRLIQGLKLQEMGRLSDAEKEVKSAYLTALPYLFHTKEQKALNR